MRRATVRDGTEIAYFAEAAAPGTPTFVFAHATGFCAAVWEPVLAGVRREMPNAGLVVVDQRAHGSSGASPHPFDWWDVGRDAIDVVATEGVDGPLVGVGHSAGGAGLLLAEILHPGSLAGIVAIEPIVPPPPYERRDPPIARNAARRRSWFPSRDSVRERFVARPPFSQWDPAALDGYLAHGFIEGTDPETGKPGVVLACTASDEAEWFRSAYEHGGWGRLDEVACPVVVLAGSESMTHAEGPPEEIAARLGNVRLHMVERASHFIPMELPGLVGDEAVGLAASLSR
jgi:pimeloyl-ACP methyl ester carboxylesterase